MGEIVLILILVVLFVFVLPVVALVRVSTAVETARRALREVEALELKLKHQAREIAQLREGREIEDVAEAKFQLPSRPMEEAKMEAARSAATEPPPLPQFAAPEIAAPAGRPRPESTEAGENAAMEPSPAPPKLPVAASSPSLEQFMGVKLFAWLGGVALFFGVIFFVKYAFERNLIPPSVRIALGFATGFGLLAGGWFANRKPGYRVLAHSLCATAILILYGVTFAAHAIYGFAAFGSASTMALMSLITATAFMAAVRYDALVVAVLGMLGGFVTPILLPIVQDNPFALFGYVAILDIGLLAITSRGRWSFLALGAAGGTALIYSLWHGRFFSVGRYDEGGATWVPMGILVFFGALFVASAWWANRRHHDEEYVSGSAIGIITLAMIVAFLFLGYDSIAKRTFLLYGFILLLNLGAILLSLLRPQLAMAQVAVAAATLLHLAIWTGSWLTPESLVSGLTTYLIVGGVLAAWPVVAARLPRPVKIDTAQQQAGRWVPLPVLLLMIFQIVVLPQPSLLVWIGALLINLLVVAMAVMTLAVLPVLAVFAVTLLLAGFWLFYVPAEAASLGPFLAIVALIAVGFSGAGVWLAKIVKMRGGTFGTGSAAAIKSMQIQLMAAAAPFLLLALAIVQLPVVNPSPVLGVVLLLVALLMGLAVIGRQPLLFAVALASTLVVEFTWHGLRFDVGEPWLTLPWYLGFYAVFTAIPFVFRKCGEKCVIPWAVGSLSGVGHFLLVYDVIRKAFPNDMLGLVPAAFAIPALVALVVVIRSPRDENAEVHRGSLAWLGGVALLFITLIFPIQFERQWITVSWALEGAALVWLYTKIRHQGVLSTGIALLVTVFARLALNPAAFMSYVRSGTPILNWHLYVYGIAVLSHFAAARWIPESSSRIAGMNARAVLWSLGGILLFLLVNVEIADFFTPQGDRFIAFQFVGNFARDMTYTIAWGLFSLGLLITGILLHAKGARYAAIGLLVATLLKLFLHDLANIESIYRIAALVSVAVIAFVASFLYQRFFNQSAKTLDS
jgi:uncharacterized membrane protein